MSRFTPSLTCRYYTLFRSDGDVRNRLRLAHFSDLSTSRLVYTSHTTLPEFLNATTDELSWDG